MKKVLLSFFFVCLAVFSAKAMNEKAALFGSNSNSRPDIEALRVKEQNRLKELRKIERQCKRRELLSASTESVSRDNIIVPVKPSAEELARIREEKILELRARYSYKPGSPMPRDIQSEWAKLLECESDETLPGGHRINGIVLSPTWY